jgi:hypothetical protein
MQINRCRVKLLPIDFIGIRAHVDLILVKPTIEGFIKPKDLDNILFIIIFYMTCNEIPTKYHKKKKEKRKEGKCISKNETPIGIGIYAKIKHEINHELKFHKLQEDDGCVDHKVTTSL